MQLWAKFSTCVIPAREVKRRDSFLNSKPNLKPKPNSEPIKLECRREPGEFLRFKTLVQSLSEIQDLHRARADCSEQGRRREGASEGERKLRKTIKRKGKRTAGSLILFARTPERRARSRPLLASRPLNGTKRGETTKITLLPYRGHSTVRPILYDFYTNNKSSTRRLKRAARDEQMAQPGGNYRGKKEGEKNEGNDEETTETYTRKRFSSKV